MQRRTISNDEGWLMSYADLITNLLIFFAMLLGASEISRTRMQQIASDISGEERPESLASIQQEIESRIEQEGLKDSIHTHLSDSGLRVSLNSGLVFASGGATILPEQEAVLDRMLTTLVPYDTRYTFAVEGHTDSIPFIDPTGARTNWHLSTDRANAVRGRMEAVGLSGSRIRVEGYADTVPLSAEELEGLSPDEQLARHRRVIVRVY